MSTAFDAAAHAKARASPAVANDAQPSVDRTASAAARAGHERRARARSRSSGDARACCEPVDEPLGIMLGAHPRPIGRRTAPAPARTAPRRSRPTTGSPVASAADGHRDERAMRDVGEEPDAEARRRRAWPRSATRRTRATSRAPAAAAAARSRSRAGARRARTRGPRRRGNDAPHGPTAPRAGLPTRPSAAPKSAAVAVAPSTCSVESHGPSSASPVHDGGDGLHHRQASGAVERRPPGDRRGRHEHQQQRRREGVAPERIGQHRLLSSR